MDRTIHYFQDMTEYGSHNPTFPGYEKLEKSGLKYFQDMRKLKKKQFSNISRILENVRDFDFQYFQAGNN